MSALHPQENVRAWIGRHLRRYRGVMSTMLLLQMLCALLISVQPVLFQRIVTLVVSSHDVFPIGAGVSLLCDLAVVYLLGTLLQGLGGYVAALFSSDFLKQLQVDFFEKMIRLPIQTLQKQSAGEIFTKFSSDTSQVEMLLVVFIPSVIREFLTALAVTCFLLSACPILLTGTALGIVVVTSCTTALLHIVMERFARKQREQSGTINSLLDETLQGIDTLKTLASEDRRSQRFAKLAVDLRDISVKAGITGASFSSALDFVSKCGGILLIFLAYRLIAHGEIDSEAFLLFFFYAGILQMSVSSLVSSLASFQPQLVGLRNVANFLAEPVEEKRHPDPTCVISGSVPIALSRLTFGYPGKELLFREAEFLAPANKTTLIHGPSGSGKSTLINLMHGFYAPSQGTILFGGIPIDRLDRLELRRKVGVVTQDHFIFSESVRDNIRIANPEADDRRIMDALARTHLDGLVKRLPGGLDYRLDPRGKGLSAGERQRICIARILLTDSPIMLLDEPWSNLDEGVRNLLAQVLNECRSHKTIVIMSHEDIPSLIVDNIYRLVPETKKIVREEKRWINDDPRWSSYASTDQ
jgi:ABC-type bacteriocin/lantibiotic exporter with double-glycine peptidase domain